MVVVGSSSFSGRQHQSNSLLAENNEVKAFEYLRYELPTRLANILKEVNRLPKELLGLFKIKREFRGEIFPLQSLDIMRLSWSIPRWSINYTV